MRKLPLVVLMVLLFALAPLGYLTVVSKYFNKESVRGIESTSLLNEGLSFIVVSRGGTWDLHEYLCESRSECMESLMSGKEWSVVSGGASESHEVKIIPNEKWSSYKLMKFFVKPGWGSMSREFQANTLISMSSVEVTKMLYEGQDYNVILVPVSEINANTHMLIEFLDY